MSADEAIVLDTHIWLMLLDGRKLSPRTQRRINQAAKRERLYIAAITVWEVAMLTEKRRLKVSGPVLNWISDALHKSAVLIHPLEPVVAVDAATLPLFHGDPADRMIVATSRRLDAALFTRDEAILAYGRTRQVNALDPS